MSGTVIVEIAGTPTPIVLFDGNTLEAARLAALSATAAAAASATAAAGSATNAAGSATNAAGSAVNALSSRDQAASSAASAETAKLSVLTANVLAERPMALRRRRLEMNGNYDAIDRLPGYTNDSLNPQSGLSGAVITVGAGATVQIEASGEVTYTIPQNGWLRIALNHFDPMVGTTASNGTTGPPAWAFVCIVEAGEISLDAITMQARYAANDPTQGGGFFTENVDRISLTRPYPGVALFGSRNWNGTANVYSSGGHVIFIQNPGTTAITILKPFMKYDYTTVGFDGKIPHNMGLRYPPRGLMPASMPIRDFEFWKGWGEDRLARHLLEKQTTGAADFVLGLNTNAGARRTPKKTIEGATGLNSLIVNEGTYALARGSRFREELTNQQNWVGVDLRDLTNGKSGYPLPILDAYDEVPNGSWVATGDGTYNFTPITYTGGPNGSSLVDNGYDFIGVLEIDIAEEAAGRPWSARRALARTTSQAACAAKAGSYYVQNLGAGSFRRYIRPSDSAAPGTKYRYDVINRWQQIPWYIATGRSVQGVHLLGSGSGYGSVPMGDDALMDRVIMMHSTAHTTVIRGGIIQRSLLYSPGYEDSQAGPAITFYEANAVGQKGILRQLISLNVPSVFYNHTSSGPEGDYDEIRVEDCVMVGPPRSNHLASNGLGLWGQAVGAANVKKATIERCYFEQYADPCSLTHWVPNTSIKNCAFVDVARIRSSKIFHNNVVRYTNYSDSSNVNNRGAANFLEASSSVQNNFMHAKMKTSSVSSDNGFNMGLTYNAGSKFKRNIVVVEHEIGISNGFLIGQLGDLALAPGHQEIDQNVYINCVPNAPIGAGGKLGTGSNDPNIFGWVKYKERINFGGGAYENGSFYFDLSRDPRGINAVFVDAANLDYRWADTDIAREIAKAVETTGAGPDWMLMGKPNIPTIEEAVDIINRL